MLETLLEEDVGEVLYPPPWQAGTLRSGHISAFCHHRLLGLGWKCRLDWVPWAAVREAGKGERKGRGVLVTSQRIRSQNVAGST